MSVYLGGGWRLVHLTDRVLELRKECPIYRRMLGRDGYVRLRAEPGMDRNGLIDKAVEMAKRNDEDLSQRVARQLMPSKASVARYQIRQQQLTHTFGISGEQKEYRP